MCVWASGRWRTLARHAAADVDDFYTARRPDPRPELVLGLQCDGKGIVMRPGHLRAGTAKAAADAKASATSSTRLAPGHKHGRRRMAEIVAVYDLAPRPRTIDDIITPGTRRSEQPGKQPGTVSAGPVVTGKWVHANITEHAPP